VALTTPTCFPRLATGGCSREVWTGLVAGGLPFYAWPCSGGGRGAPVGARRPTGMISLPLPAPHLHQCESLDSSSIILAIGRSVKNYQFHPWFLNPLID